MATTTNHQQLLEWFQDPINKCFFNGDALTVKQSSNGLGVFAKKTLDPEKPDLEDPEPNLLLQVHKSMVLCGRNCTIANLLYDEDLDGLDGVLLATIYEIQLMEKSPWFTYLKSINHTTDPSLNLTEINNEPGIFNKKGSDYITPLCLWGDKEKSLLEGTEIEELKGLDESQLKYHYAVSITFANRMHDLLGLPIPNILQNTLPPGGETDSEFEDEEDDDNEFNEQKYHQFGALFWAITSRAFEVDNYLDLALVPGADLFNHDPNGEENVHFLTQGDVCHYCGKDSCGHLEHGPPDSELESDADDESDDDDDDKEEEEEEEYTKNSSEIIGNSTDNAAKEAQDLKEITMDMIEEIEKELVQEAADAAADEDSDMDPDMDPYILEAYMDPDECCAIVLERKVKRGNEVFNTYGDLSNAELLIKYGFCVDDNINDTLNFGQEFFSYICLVLKAAEEGDEEAQNVIKRLHWWSQYGLKELKTYIMINQQEDEEDDESEEDEKNDTAEHSHDHEHNHEHDGDCHHGDPDEGDDDEWEWMNDCKLGFPGNFNGFAVATATLLTTSQENMNELYDAFQDPELMEAPGFAGAVVEKKLIIDCGKEPYPLLKKLCEDKLARIGDSNNKSGDYKRLIKKSTGRRKSIYTLLMNEKKMLDYAIKQLK